MCREAVASMAMRRSLIWARRSTHDWCNHLWSVIRVCTKGSDRQCRDPGSNRGHLDLQSNALPTELSRRVFAIFSHFDSRLVHLGAPFSPFTIGSNDTATSLMLCNTSKTQFICLTCVLVKLPYCASASATTTTIAFVQFTGASHHY